MPEAQEVQTDLAYVIQSSLVHDVTATHQARSGASYELSAQKPCEMPLEDAYTFLVDPAFEVRDSRGRVIRPPSTKKVEGGRVMLEENEVIAGLEELTKDALLKRCKRHEGSDGIKLSTSKDDMTSFLIAHARVAAEIGQGRGSEGVVAEMGAEALDSLVDLTDRIN
jgi:hypothetical protein